MRKESEPRETLKPENQITRTLMADAVWADEIVIDGNSIQNLLMPAGEYSVEVNEGGCGRVWNSCGEWAVTPNEDPANLSTTVIPNFLKMECSWRGPRRMPSPAEVVSSYKDAIAFTSHETPNSLRRPQIGALHAVVGYWTSGIPKPGIVVMPTGTGKTDSMIAIQVAAAIERLLVVVPTDALREQLAGKFETLGLLQSIGVVAHSARRPVVGRVGHGFSTVDNAVSFARSCNVVVATPNALHASSVPVREVLLAEFSHLFVDEAHHALAQTWSEIIKAFKGKPVLLFTATPYRGDGQRIPGDVVYRFPLGEAQKDKYFSRINYQAVLSLDDPDKEVARRAVERLRQDVSAGHDHILMARTDTITSAEKLLVVYKRQADEYNPVMVSHKMSSTSREEALQALRTRGSRIVVCVDMLGEGFDLPALKIGAFHKAKQSLGAMIQLIGRFARSPDGETVGEASVFVARDPSIAVSPLRELLAEDADWNLLLHDITESIADRAQRNRDFEDSFADVPESVPVQLLQPKMSAVAYRMNNSDWNPHRALDVYPADTVIGGQVSVGASGDVAWFVTYRTTAVKWGRIPDLVERDYELVAMYRDRKHQMLYIYGSAKEGVYQELAEAVCRDESVMVIRGSTVFRVLGGIERLVPSNIGLLDVKDMRKRFTLLTGSDVNEALTPADTGSKSQTHIVTSGFEDGERTSISASLTGRFWSLRSAENLGDWVSWCDVQGRKLRDHNINISKLFSNLIIPTELRERPEGILLAVDWPWDVYMSSGGGKSLEYQGVTVPILDCQFRVDDYSESGSFKFSLVTSEWSVAYVGEVDEGGLALHPVADDVTVVRRVGTLTLREWFAKNPPTLFLSGDVLVERNQVYQSRSHIPPWDPERLEVLDWSEVDIRRESQGPGRNEGTVQRFMSQWAQSHLSLDILIDDDGAGEAADLVGFTRDENELHVYLIHCKYSASDTPGARVKDVYEVSGQAIRSAKWRQNGVETLLKHSAKRAQQYFSRTGTSPFEVGELEDLFRIQEVAQQLIPVFHVIIVQPGISASACSAEQLRVIAGADTYVQQTTKGDLRVLCSE